MPTCSVEVLWVNTCNCTHEYLLLQKGASEKPDKSLAPPPGLHQTQEQSTQPVLYPAVRQAKRGNTTMWGPGGQDPIGASQIVLRPTSPAPQLFSLPSSGYISWVLSPPVVALRFHGWTGARRAHCLFPSSLMKTLPRRLSSN